YRERQQRKPPVDTEHYDGHDGERKKVVDDGENSAREHLVDGIDVGGEARDKAADRVGVEKAYVQALHLAEYLTSQIEHDLLPGPLHQVGLDEFEEIRADLEAKINRCQLRDAARGVVAEVMREPCGRAESVSLGVGGSRAGREVVVDADHDEERTGDIAERFECDRD